jgi:hypothetical protein
MISNFFDVNVRNRSLATVWELVLLCQHFHWLLVRQRLRHSLKIPYSSISRSSPHSNSSCFLSCLAFAIVIIAIVIAIVMVWAIEQFRIAKKSFFLPSHLFLIIPSTVSIDRSRFSSRFPPLREKELRFEHLGRWVCSFASRWNTNNNWGLMNILSNVWACQVRKGSRFHLPQVQWLNRAWSEVKCKESSLITLSIIWTSITWMRPMILWVPTPRAIPAYLRSTNLMMPHLSAHCCDMMVLCAPESTKA